MAYDGLASSYFLTDRFPEAESTLQRASERKLENPNSLVLRYNIAVLKRRPGADGPGSRSGQRKAQGGTLDGPRRRLLPWLVPAGYRPPGGHRAGPWIWPCKKGNASRPRVTGPHERCGKPLAGMLPKEKGTPWRRSSFQRAGTSNMPLALRWLFQETIPDQRRSPAIWIGVSRKIHL